MIAVMLQAPPLPRHVPPAERGWHFLLHRAPDRMSQGVSGRDEMGVSGSREVSGNPSDPSLTARAVNHSGSTCPSVQGHWGDPVGGAPLTHVPILIMASDSLVRALVVR